MEVYAALDPHLAGVLAIALVVGVIGVAMILKGIFALLESRP